MLRVELRQKSCSNHLEKLINMETKMLTESLLNQYPVWTWNESNDARCPVYNHEPLPGNVSSLFIKAQFTTAEGDHFTGYLSGRKKFHAFTLFFDGISYHFNLNLGDQVRAKASELGVALGKTDFKLLPLRYTSEVHFEGEANVEGFLGLS